MFKKKCKDCGKLISKNAKKCRSCSKKGIKRSLKQRKTISIRTKQAMQRPEVQIKIRKSRGGKSKINYCPDCGKSINYKAKKCRTHAYKGRIYSKEHNEKLRLISLNRFKNPKNHPCYIPGLDRLYPLNFNEKLKRKIRIRDNYTCQICGISQQDFLKLKRGQLTIHHINYDKFNCEKNNLITLCNSCHMKTNFNRDYWYAYFNYKKMNRDDLLCSAGLNAERCLKRTENCNMSRENSSKERRK